MRAQVRTTVKRMAALYPQWANTAYRLALVTLILLVPTLLVALMLYVRTPWNTEQFQPVTQPVEFDHRHHVIDDEIDCLYCHADAERSAHAGVPSTEVCMGCHAQIWNESPLLEPVRRSYFSGKPIRWNRVHDLADFVYFNHAVHVTGGVDCVHCHGRVERMARVYQAAPLTMGWCLDCHRNPKAYLARAGGVEAETMVGATLQNIADDISDHRQTVTRLTTCTACHR